MRTIVVTGTGTGVGKTVVTAAVAACATTAGLRVAVVKPAQTGVGPDEPGDLAEVARLAGVTRTVELARFDEPLAPGTAARRAGAPGPGADEVGAAVCALDADLVLVEGAGGLLVHLDAAGTTLADVALRVLGRSEHAEPHASSASDAPSLATRGRGAVAESGVLLVAAAGLGVLNHAALTAEALAHRGVPLLGTVVGAYPAEPDLAERTNLADLPRVTGAPLLGVLPDGAARDAAGFAALARAGLAPALGGSWSPDAVGTAPDVASIARGDGWSPTERR